VNKLLYLSPFIYQVSVSQQERTSSAKLFKAISKHQPTSVKLKIQVC